MAGERKTTKGDVAWWFFVAILVLGFASPAAPLFYRYLIPFPTLEDAQHLVGTVEVRLTGKPRPLSRIFVVTEGRRVEVACGFSGERRDCSDFSRIDGASGDIWYDRIYGVVQWRLVHPRTGQTFEMPIEVVREVVLHRKSYSEYVGRLVFSFVLLGAIIMFGRNHSRRRH